MKKNYNVFKSLRLSNLLRTVILVCAAAVVLMIVLYASIPENRYNLFGWLGISQPNLTKQADKSSQTDDLGLASSIAVNQNISVRPLDRNDHLWGPIDAAVNLIVYDDFECPFCAQLYETINLAKGEFGNSLVVAIRNFPLISHEQAIPAAQAAECASAQNKYWEMYRELFEDTKSGKLVPEEIANNAKMIGLDMTAFTLCLTKEKYKDKIMAEKEEVKELGIIGTPASFLNNQYIPGALPYDDFTYPDGTAGLGLRSLIQQALEKK